MHCLGCPDVHRCGGVLCARACLEGIVSWLVSCWYGEKYWGAAHGLVGIMHFFNAHGIENWWDWGCPRLCFCTCWKHWIVWGNVFFTLMSLPSFSCMGSWWKVTGLWLNGRHHFYIWCKPGQIPSSLKRSLHARTWLSNWRINHGKYWHFKGISNWVGA